VESCSREMGSLRVVHSSHSSPAAFFSSTGPRRCRCINSKKFHPQLFRSFSLFSLSENYSYALTYHTQVHVTSTPSSLVSAVRCCVLRLSLLFFFCLCLHFAAQPSQSHHVDTSHSHTLGRRIERETKDKVSIPTQLTFYSSAVSSLLALPPPWSLLALAAPRRVTPIMK